MVCGGETRREEGKEVEKGRKGEGRVPREGEGCVGAVCGVGWQSVERSISQRSNLGSQPMKEQRCNEMEERQN
jgi:hypothetical protein